MDWKEHQDAASLLYEQAEGSGNVKGDARVFDRVTGQPRQVNTLIEIEISY
jgi:hypothetical protein